MAPFRFRVRIRPDHDLPGLFDMLRYDRATVIDWNHASASQSQTGREFYALTLTSPVTPTTDRWSSFGLVVTDIERV